jgi:hypothetical protein
MHQPGSETLGVESPSHRSFFRTTVKPAEADPNLGAWLFPQSPTRTLGVCRGFGFAQNTSATRL